MNMTEEALKLLIDTAQEADSRQELWRDETAITFYGKDGKPLVVPKMPAPRAHAAGSLDEIIALANRFAETTAKPVVWYGLGRIVLVMDDNGHRVDTATFPLELSDTMTIVLGLKKRLFTDKEFVKFLRNDLTLALPPTILLEHVKTLRWGTATAAVSTQGKMKESYDRSVTHDVTAGGTVPDSVCLSLPVWKSAGMREVYELRCTVDIDPGIERCALIPFPDEIERVQQKAIADVGERLREGLKGVPAYHGQP